LRGLLRLLREHPDAVESDLSRYHNIDYRDRRRFDPDGRRKLTLQMIAVRVRYLPPDSATARAEGSSGRTDVEVLLMDLYGAMTGEQHPRYPKDSKAVDPEREKHLRAARIRAHERQRAIDAGEIT